MSFERQREQDHNEAAKQRIPEVYQRERLIHGHGMLPLIGAVALQALITYHERPAEAAEVRSGMTWQEGFSELREDVYKSPTEQAADAIVRTDGVVYWVGSEQGEETSVGRGADAILESVKDEIANKSLESLCSTHTHSILSAEKAKIIDHKPIEEALANMTTTLSFPPSYGDVKPSLFSVVGIDFRIEEAGGYVVNVVLDPSRVWRHRAVTDADQKRFPDYFKEISDAKKTLAEWRQHTSQLLETFTEERLDHLIALLPKNEQESVRSLEAHRRNFTAQQILEAKQGAIRVALLSENNLGLAAEVFRGNDVGIKLQERILLIVEGQKRDIVSWQDVVYKKWVPASLQGEPSPELYAKLIEAYLRIGIVLESFTYKEVEDDPLKLCRWPESRIQK